MPHPFQCPIQGKSLVKFKTYLYLSSLITVFLEFQPVYSGTGHYLGLSECVVCPVKDNRRLVIDKKYLEKHRQSHKHRSCVEVARLKLEGETNENRSSEGDTRICSTSHDQAFTHDMDPLPSTLINAGAFADATIGMPISDAPVSLPEPGQDYFDEYQEALLRGDRLFEIRLPPYKESDDMGFNHKGDLFNASDAYCELRLTSFRNSIGYDRTFGCKFRTR